MKLLRLDSGSISEVEVSVGTLPTNPDFSYTDGNLTRIDYSDSSYKILEYSLDGTLTRTEYYSGGTIYRKDYFYDVDGNLDYITEGFV